MVAAIDCDLRKFYAVSNDGVVLCNGGSINDCRNAVASHDVVLFEIAGLVYAKRQTPAAIQNFTRWAIYNAAAAAALALPQLRVATSAVWSRGHPEEVRQKVAKANARNKHLRDAQAMIYYYNLMPTLWVPLETYLENL